VNANESRINAQTISGIQLNEVTSFLWVKDAIREIVTRHYKAGKKVTDTFDNAVKGQKYSFTKELVRLIGVQNASGRTVSPNFGYVVDSDNTIEFADAGTYQATYYSMPSMPQTTEEQLPIPQPYQECIPYYLASKIRARLFGQTDADAVSFMQQFQEALIEANSAVNRQASRGRRMPPRR
jgi:hypothetical protein